MKTIPSLLGMIIITLFVFGCANNAKKELTWYASGNQGIVAGGSSASAQVGKDILEQGGNAVDAAVAVIINLAVTDYGLFCMGGEVPFMYYNSKTGMVKVFNGMGGAPAGNNAIQWYYKNGIPKNGIRASTVPSAVSTCMVALENNGTMSFEQVIAPTLTLLDTGGKSWYTALAITLRKLIDTEKNTPGTRQEKIRKARDRFYKGDIADELGKYYEQSGAFLSKADLEAHETLIEEPVMVNYRGYQVYKCNTWTQGPVLLQTLRLIEKSDIKSMGFLSPDYVHILTEAMKLAYADRDKYYGDPAYVDVPLKQLLSNEYTALRWPLIDMLYASQIIRPGNPVNMTANADTGQYWKGDHGTTTCVVTDKWGNLVAATPSANPEYGLCESLGIAHNTRLSSLNTQKGHPNSLQAGKRPRITLTPTIVLKNGKPVLAKSICGGDVQDQVALELFLDYVEFGMLPKEAVSAPRFRTYHFENSFNPSPNPYGRILRMNGLTINTTNNATIEALINKGHAVNAVKGIIGVPVMVYLDQKSGVAYAAGEPNVKYCAAASSTPKL